MANFLAILVGKVLASYIMAYLLIYLCNDGEFTFVSLSLLAAFLFPTTFMKSKFAIYRGPGGSGIFR